MPHETPGYHGLCCSCCYRVIHGDPYLSPSQTNPTATPWDGVEGRDLTFGRDDDGETEEET